VLSRPAKVVFLTLGAVAVLLSVSGLAAAIYLTYNAKARVEALASDMLGMDVTIRGAVHIGLVPSLDLALADVHLSSQHNEFASAGAVSLGVELLPLFHHQVRFDRITVKRVSISLERDRNGTLNVQGSGRSGPLPDVAIAKVSGSKVTLRYQDDQSGNGFLAQDCSLDLGRLRVLAGERGDWVKYVAFAGKVSCPQFRVLNALQLSDLSTSVEGADAVVDFNPVAFRLFDGQGSGSVRVDLSRDQTLYEIRSKLTAFRLEEFSKTLSANPVGSGALDFAANLSMRGATLEDLTRTADGNASLRGKDLTLQLGDLDKKFEQFAATQNFGLVDAGAFLLAGPIGLGITKGYDYSRVLRTTPGTTHVRTLVSEWRVANGVARATDVAMATNKNRVALRGGLDFVTRQFDDVTLALVDPEGCAEAQQTVHGSFLEPKADAPSVLRALAGPTRRLFSKATSLLGNKCVSFYSGSVEAPQ
jgi:AsmA family/AsmA-like C-terminal region